jgi:hypothetical protein
MRGKKDRNAEIVTPNAILYRAEARDEMIRISSVFSALGHPSSKDIKRMCARGFGAPGRLIILSHMLFPQICSTIGRGLTLEELGCLTGIDQVRVKNALRSSAVKRAMTFTSQEADMTGFIKVAVPLKVTFQNENGTQDVRTENTPLLARSSTVDDIRRKGYVTNDGKVIKHDYLTFMPGPPPTLYLFKNQRDVARDEMGEGWEAEMAEKYVGDAGVSRAMKDARTAQLEFFKGVVLSEHAPTLLEQMARFFYESCDNVRCYAFRYQALNDRATFDRIQELADAFIMIARCMEELHEGGRERMDDVVDEIDRMLDELKKVV